MQLTVPHRTVADTGSSPVNPDGVAEWLKNLKPLQSEADAHEVYRGLKHSNRLHNDVDNRRAVLSRFIPVLRLLHSHLNELSYAQPLPLTREFSRNSRLRDALLREEAFAFKILLSDNNTPMADDARRAMQALARQAEALAHAYRPVPAALIQDAHQLYALAEEHKLLSDRQGSELLSLQDHYRFILLISISDLAQQRARQVHLVLNFLRSCAGDIHIEKDRDLASLNQTDYAVNLHQGSRPEPASSLLGEDPGQVRWFSIAPAIYRIEKSLATLQNNSGSAAVVSDTLERQSLVRLQAALLRTRQRRSSRQIVHEARHVVLGHKEICAHLLYRPEENLHSEPGGWTVINFSSQGMCMQNEKCQAGDVQVGELVSVTEYHTRLRGSENDKSSKLDAMLGVVRWIRAVGTEGICMGLEFLATSVIPVRVTRGEYKPPQAGGSTSTNRLPATTQAVGESALIIACKIQNTIMQTILVPAYLYHSGDNLTAMQGGRSRRVKLSNCVQTNGLFSQFVLVDAERTNPTSPVS